MDMTCSRPIAGRARMRTSAAEEALHDPGLRSASRPRPFTGKEGVEALVLGVRASTEETREESRVTEELADAMHCEQLLSEFLYLG